MGSCGSGGNAVTAPDSVPHVDGTVAQPDRPDEAMVLRPAPLLLLLLNIWPRIDVDGRPLAVPELDETAVMHILLLFFF